MLAMKRKKTNNNMQMFLEMNLNVSSSRKSFVSMILGVMEIHCGVETSDRPDKIKTYHHKGCL